MGRYRGRDTVLWRWKVLLRLIGLGTVRTGRMCVRIGGGGHRWIISLQLVCACKVVFIEELG